MKRAIKSLAYRFSSNNYDKNVNDKIHVKNSEEYWSGHNVTNHIKFKTDRDSLNYFDWRNDQYIDYIKLLPVTGHDGEVILDFGCGPGNDLVGFLTHSKPARLVGADVSLPSLEEARDRTGLHEGNVEFIKILEDEPILPFDDNEFDYIHCSGVLMCTKYPEAILREFRRILKPEGCARVMVYNYDSIWLHLYVAYILRRNNPSLSPLSVIDAFMKSTDGEDCPVNNCWSVKQFASLAQLAGLSCKHLGNAISLIEMSVLSERFTAAQSPTLEPEHRKFLLSLTFDDRLIPHYQGQVAGIDSCYELRTPGNSGADMS